MLDQKNVIYKATNLKNGKVYIGLTTEKFRKRLNCHKSSAYLPYIRHYECHFYRAIRKHGWDNFKWELIDSAETEEQLKEREVYWVSFYDSFRNGYNMTLGGDGTSGIMGESHGRAKLSQDDVVRIKQMLIDGVSQHTIANAFEVGQTMIANISANNNWTHVDVNGWNEWLEAKSRGEIIPINYLNREKGSNHVNSKLNEEKVAMIKKMLIEGVTLQSLADKFGVSKSTIGGITNNTNWLHVAVDGWEAYQEKRSNGKVKSDNQHRKYTEDDIAKVKELLVKGVKQKDISEILDIPKTTIGSIAQSRIWKEVAVDGWEEYKSNREITRRLLVS